MMSMQSSYRQPGGVLFQLTYLYIYLQVMPKKRSPIMLMNLCYNNKLLF